MHKAVMALLAALVLAAPGLARDDEGEKPELHLRWIPRLPFSPAEILFTAELKGGDDIEELYCPEIEWEFGDGGKSSSEGDCDPWEPGMKIDRRYTKRHEYRYAGSYQVKVSLSKAGDRVLSTSVTVSVRPGPTDPTRVY